MQPVGPQFPFSMDPGRMDHANQLPLHILNRQASKAISFGTAFGSRLPSLLDKLAGHEPRWLRWVREGVPVVDRVASLEDEALAEEIKKVDQYNDTLAIAESVAAKMEASGLTVDRQQLDKLQRSITISQVEHVDDGTSKIVARFDVPPERR